MANASVTIDNAETFNMIEGLIKKLEKPEPLLKVVGGYVQSETIKMFNGPRPDTTAVRGVKWPKLKESTIFKKRAMFKNGKITGGNPNRPLIESGLLRDDLMSSRAIKIQNKGLIYGTNQRNKKGFLYPAVHQTGTKVGHIPQRRWLFLNETNLNQIANMTKEYIESNKSISGII